MRVTSPGVCTSPTTLTTTGSAGPGGAGPAVGAAEVHHAPGWYPDGRTDADALYFACGPDHKLLTDGHWRAAVTAR
ncbi:hypothetical protein H7I76_00605, partial [Mycolicibacterium vaccae]|nr:hypothetical protein [Mycolicibacterium vaccae]